MKIKVEARPCKLRSFLSLEKSIKRVRSNDIAFALSLFRFSLEKRKKRRDRSPVRLYLFHADWSRDRQLDSRTRSPARAARGALNMVNERRDSHHARSSFLLFFPPCPFVLHVQRRRKAHSPTWSRIFHASRDSLLAMHVRQARSSIYHRVPFVNRTDRLGHARSEETWFTDSLYPTFIDVSVA